MDGGVKVEGIGCFVCTSIDGNNPLCDDEEKTGEKNSKLDRSAYTFSEKTIESGITNWNNRQK